MSTPARRPSAGAGWHEASPGRGAAPREGYLVLEREDRLWAVAGTSVRRLVRCDGDGPAAGGGERRPGGFLRLTVAGGDLTAHRVLAMVPDLAVTPVPGSLLRFWPEAASGLAVYEGRPLVVIDPQHPPAPLLGTGAEKGKAEED